MTVHVLWKMMMSDDGVVEAAATTAVISHPLRALFLLSVQAQNDLSHAARSYTVALCCCGAAAVVVNLCDLNC